MDKIGRIYKGEDFDLEIKVPISGDVFVDDLRLYTDCNISFRPQNITVSGNTIKVHCEDHDLDLLNDGVLKYYLKYQNYVEYIKGGDVDERIEDIINTNTMHYLKTREGYDAITPEDIYNWGKQAQKDAMTEITITQNGTYTREDGYSAVTVNVEGGGSCNMQTKNYNITSNGATTITPDAGYDGITGGTISVNVPSAGTTNLEKTININSNGNYEISTSIEHTFDWSFPSAKRCTFTLTGEWPDGRYYIGDVIPEHGGGYIEIYVKNGGFEYDDSSWNFNVGDTYFTAEGTSALTVIVDFESSFNSLEFNKNPDEYAEDGSYILGGINFKVNVPQSGHTDAELEQAYTSGYTGGEIAGAESQKALMIPFTATTNGTYSRSDGYSSFEVIVAQTGHTDAELETAYNSGYSEGYSVGETYGETVGAANQKALMIPLTATTNGTYSRENGYSSINVNVAQTGHTDAELETAYNSGYTAGMAAQKALMVGLTAITNGTYTTENGYSSVYVDVSCVDDEEFYFQARENNSKLTIASNIAYSTDKTTWNTDGVSTTFTLNSGEKVYFKELAGFQTNSYFSTFSTSVGTFNVGGKLGYFIFGSKTDGLALTNAIEYLFKGCDGLVDASKLELNVDFWTNNVQNAFRFMFDGCTSLTTPPSTLPATTLTSGCYGWMFVRCSSLTTTPPLPATTLANTCYESMFNGCTSLTTAPELPATILAEACYSGMFMGCSSLTSAPVLPVTALTVNCYSDMFCDCTSLVNAPSLPATNLAIYCYSNMFAGCTSLVTAPSLPATTLVNYCYNSMFEGCSNLQNITVSATNWNNGNSTAYWVRGVASGGTFTKPSTTSIQSGNYGIPVGWTVVNI